MITIISKIELEGTNNLKYTDVGYTSDEIIITQINENYDSTLGKFLGENRTKLEIGGVSISTFFVSNTYVNEARATLEDTSELSLIEITDINQL